MLNIKKAKKRFAALESEKDKWLPYWKDIKDYINPYRGFFSENPNKGERYDYRMYNSEAFLCCTVLSSGMQGGITPRARPWFRLGVYDSAIAYHPFIKEYLYACQEIIYSVLARSNAYNCFHGLYGELGVFGTAAMLIEEDFLSGVRCQIFTAGEYMIATNAFGMANTFARKFQMTTLQMVEMFGLDKVSQEVRHAYEQDTTEQWHTVYHLIEPNDDRMPDYKDYKNKPFRSLYWQDKAGDGEFLRMAGYDEFPVIAPRWDVIASNVYGISPGWHALSDSKMLQELEKDKLVAVQKVVNPPVKMTTSVFNRGVVNINPKGVNVVDDPAMSGIAPVFQIAPDIKAVQFAIDATVQSLRRAFFYDLFLMFAQETRVNVTATEVARKNEEKLLVLGPVLERLENEMLNPVIERIFNILDRNGMLPPLPEEFQGMEIKVEYTSILAQAQKMIGITGIEQVAGFVGNLSASFPEALDKFNAIKAVDEYSNMVGPPPGIIRSDEEVAAIQQARQQQQEQQQAMQMAMGGAQGAKLLSETDTGGNNMLNQLLGGGG